MNKSLFVYITYESGLQSVGNLRTQLSLGFDQKNPFYLLPSKEAKSMLSDTDCPDAILVYDRISIEKFCTNISKIESNYEKIFIAWHSNGELKPADDKSIKACAFKSKILSQPGAHTSSNPLYKTALYFINAESDAMQKALRVFEGNPALHSKLNILHLCLTPQGAKEVCEQDLSELTEQERNAFETFNISTTNLSDPLDTSYTDALRQLRDAWLT